MKKLTENHQEGTKCQRTKHLTSSWAGTKTSDMERLGFSCFTKGKSQNLEVKVRRNREYKTLIKLRIESNWVFFHSFHVTLQR